MVEDLGVFSRTEGDQFVIFRSDQRDLPDDEQCPAVAVIHRRSDFIVSWTTHLSAMAVQREATEYLGVLHGVTVSYGQPESAPTATFTTSLISPHVPLTALSLLIAETTPYYPRLSSVQLKEHLSRFINPPGSSKT